MSLEDLERKNTEFRTICRDCIFAEFTPDWLTQVGCRLGRLSKYRDKDLVIMKEDDETAVEYYEIKTVCNTHRDSTWQYATENPVENVKKFVRTQVDFIVLADTVDINWENLLLNMTKDFLKHSYHPTKIIFGFYQKKILFHDLSAKLDEILYGTNITYDLVNVIDYVHDSWELIDILFKKVKSQYFTICELGDTLPDNWIERINNYINEDLNNLSMLEPVDGMTGLTIQKFLYSVIGGSLGINIIDKIKDLAKSQNLQSMVRHWDEL